MTESTIVWYCTQSDRECCAKVFVSSEISSKGRKNQITIYIITTVCHTAQHELFPLLFIICHVRPITSTRVEQISTTKIVGNSPGNMSSCFEALASVEASSHSCLAHLYLNILPFTVKESKASQSLGRIRRIYESVRSICWTKNSAQWDPGSFLIHNARALAGVLSGTFVCALIEKHKVISRCWK